MKIMRIYQKLPPMMGGMEKHIASLTHEQIKEGAQVDLFFSEGDKLSQHDVQLNLIPYTKIKPQALSNFLFYSHIIFYCLIKRKKYDLIHIHGDWSSFIFSKLLKLLTSSKIIIGSFHGKIKRHKFKVYKFAYQQPDILYVTGKSEATFLNHYLSSNVSWIHSGVNEIFYQTDCKVKSIDVLTVANCLSVKNIELLISIAQLLPFYTFVHIGGGNWESYAEQAKSLGIFNIKFRGPQTLATIANSMACAKVFLLTSHEEGTPTVILEALVSKCYVVTTNSCDFSDIINENNGYVGTSFDANEFSDRISQFIKSEYLDFLANEKSYSSYSWPEIAKRISELSTDYLSTK